MHICMYFCFSFTCPLACWADVFSVRVLAGYGSALFKGYRRMVLYDFRHCTLKGASDTKSVCIYHLRSSLGTQLCSEEIQAMQHDHIPER